MTRTMCFVFLAFILFAGPAAALELSPDRSAAAIDQDVDFGLLDGETALVYKAYAFFEPESLPSAYLRESESTDRFACATAFLKDLLIVLPSLSEPARDEIARVLPRLGRGSGYGDAPVLHGAAAALGDFEESVIAPNVHKTEHFAVRWGNSFAFDGDTIGASRVGEILEEVWDTEVDEMGYDAPYNSNLYYTDVYVGNSGGGVPTISFLGAYTTLYWGDDTMSYIVVHPDIFFV
ncbi:MAG: hypothetical protein M5R36_01740 [Deltaproteobacteria bacterium]|nr:hypothetical protein [Deltaproteobacteria bacterium]